MAGTVDASGHCTNGTAHDTSAKARRSAEKVSRSGAPISWPHNIRVRLTVSCLVLRPSTGAQIVASLLVCLPFIVVTGTSLFLGFYWNRIPVVSDLVTLFVPALFMTTLGGIFLFYLFLRQTYRVKEGVLYSRSPLLSYRTMRLSEVASTCLARMDGKEDPRGIFLKLTAKSSDHRVLLNTSIHDISAVEDFLEKHGIEFQ